MQILADDRVELTIMLDKMDYRRISTDLGRPRRWTSLLLLPIPLGAFVSLAAEQLIGAATSIMSMVLVLVFAAVHRRVQIGRLPDWAFGPTTYRVTADGVEIEQAVARRSIRWAAVDGCRKTAVAYWIVVPGGASIALPRRQLTGRDEAALEWVLTRYCPGVRAAESLDAPAAPPHPGSSPTAQPPADPPTGPLTVRNSSFD